MRRLLLAALAACAPSGGNLPDTTTSGATSSTTGDVPTTSGATDGCMGSADCETDAICVADFTPSDDPEHPPARGPAACTAKDTCIGALDLERWCFDHQGCCESLRCRTADGVCEPPHLGQTTGIATTSSSSTDPATTDATDTDATDTSTTDTGTDTSTSTSG